MCIIYNQTVLSLSCACNFKWLPAQFACTALQYFTLRVTLPMVLL